MGVAEIGDVRDTFAVRRRLECGSTSAGEVLMGPRRDSGAKTATAAERAGDWGVGGAGVCSGNLAEFHPPRNLSATCAWGFGFRGGDAKHEIGGRLVESFRLCMVAQWAIAIQSRSGIPAGIRDARLLARPSDVPQLAPA